MAQPAQKNRLIPFRISLSSASFNAPFHNSIFLCVIYLYHTYIPFSHKYGYLNKKEEHLELVDKIHYALSYIAFGSKQKNISQYLKNNNILLYPRDNQINIDLGKIPIIEDNKKIYKKQLTDIGYFEEYKKMIEINSNLS